MKSGMMMFQKKATVFVALILGMVLMVLDTAHGCSCLSLPGLCDYYDAADVVVHGKVVSRSSESSSTVSDSSSSIFFSPATYEYTIDIITIYKNEPEIAYDEQISFFTGTSSAACGISPDIDGEYLFGLYWSEGSSDSTDDGQLRANLCGLNREWSTVDEDELDGCTSDACDGACDEFEECLQYEKNEKWYCSEICADGACDVGESCKTKSRFWCKFSSYDGCPQWRVCY